MDLRRSTLESRLQQKISNPLQPSRLSFGSLRNSIDSSYKSLENLTPLGTGKSLMVLRSGNNVKGFQNIIDDQKPNQYLQDSYVTKMFNDTKLVPKDFMINSFDLQLGNSIKRENTPKNQKQNNSLQPKINKFQLKDEPSCQSEAADEQDINDFSNDKFDKNQKNTNTPNFAFSLLNSQQPSSVKKHETQPQMNTQQQQQQLNGCNCKKSKCLKLYCECFSYNMMCSKDCKCVSCQNVQDSKQRENAVISISNKNPSAFKSKIELKSGKILKNDDSVAKTGCNCKKTYCRKKYCECYNAGIKCSHLCKCEQCMNGNEHDNLYESKKSFSFGEENDFVSKKLCTSNKKIKNHRQI